MNALSANGATIHFKVKRGGANANTLVFINSLGTDFRIWDDVVEALGSRFNLVFHDKRGHGLSTLGEAAPSIKTYADDVEQVIKHVGLGGIVLVGLSVGGLIAQDLMQRATLDVKAAVLSNTGLKIGTDDTWNNRISGIETQGLDQISHGVMERWFSPQFRAGRPELLELYRTMLSRTPEAGYLACCKAIRDAKGFNHASSPRPVPTLCIGGSLDGSTPPALVQAMAANIAGATYREFEGTGHLPCIEKPVQYAEAIAEFVAAI